MNANFHTHCVYCDGKEAPDIYIQEAIKKNFVSIGFSCHAPIPFGNDWHMSEDRITYYINEINNLKKIYKDRIEIYKGLEIDYLEKDDRDIFNKYSLDFIIGSIHFLKSKSNGYFPIDVEDSKFEKVLSQLTNGNIKELVSMYYKNLLEMVKKYKPDIIGHFDLIKKNNTNHRYFKETESWYIDLVKDVLCEIKKSNLIVEVNTGGMIRGYLNDIYPSQEILKECKKMNIPIMINSDAHSPKDIDGYFSKAKAIINEIGYNQQRIIVNGKWTDVSI